MTNYVRTNEKQQILLKCLNLNFFLLQLVEACLVLITLLCYGSLKLILIFK